MSRSAKLACTDGHVSLFLGKPIRREDESVNSFQMGGKGLLLNGQRPELNKINWTMLADHAEHHLRVLMTGDPDDDPLADFLEIEGDSVPYIPAEDSLKDWSGIWFRLKYLVAHSDLPVHLQGRCSLG